jgi:hypothetical protein
MPAAARIIPEPRESIELLASFQFNLGRRCRILLECAALPVVVDPATGDI